MKLSFALFAVVSFAACADAFVQRPAAAASFVARRTSSSSSSEILVAHETLQGAQTMIDAIIDAKNCNPVFVRLAWHDSGTHDASITDAWPAAGGAIGSIRFAPEILHGANAGLAGAAALLEPVKEAFPDLSYADIYQMASARSIVLAGGPTIDMKYVYRYICGLVTISLTRSVGARL